MSEEQGKTDFDKALQDALLGTAALQAKIKEDQSKPKDEPKQAKKAETPPPPPPPPPKPEPIIQPEPVRPSEPKPTPKRPASPKRERPAIRVLQQTSKRTGSWVPWGLAAIFFVVAVNMGEKKPAPPHNIPADPPSSTTRKAPENKKLPESAPTWRYIRNVGTYHQHSGITVLKEEFNWGSLELRDRCAPNNRMRVCYTLIAVHKFGHPDIPNLKGTAFDKSPDMKHFYGHIPVQHTLDLMGYEVNPLLSAGPAFSYANKSDPNNRKTWNNITDIIKANPGISVLSCHYVSASPKDFYHESLFWMTTQPKGTENPDVLRRIDPNHPLLQVKPARSQCPPKYER